MKWILQLYKKFFSKEEVKGLQYTWNGLNPEIIVKNWRPGDEYWVLVWWRHFNAQSVYLGRKTQQKEETMNDNLNTTMGNATSITPPLTDEELAKLIAAKPLNGEVLGYTTDADETADELSPTIH